MNISIMSRRQIVKLIKTDGLPENTAVISFYDEYAKPVFFGESDVMVMRIPLNDNDITEMQTNYDYEHFFPNAASVARFIIKALALGKDIICQCDFGMSRSAGCAAAILEFFEGRGMLVFADKRYCPNLAVYHKLYYALCCARLEVTGVDVDKFRAERVKPDKQRILADMRAGKDKPFRECRFITSDKKAHIFRTGSDLGEFYESYNDEQILFLSTDHGKSSSSPLNNIYIDTESGVCSFGVGDIDMKGYFELIYSKYGVSEEVYYDKRKDNT